jgi:pyrimidine-nucleoside phosphorylase
MGVTIDPREFIRAKRDGLAHDPETLRAFIADCAAKKIPDYQASAWLMAAFLRGLDENETDALTQAFLRSGRIFDWSKLGVAADKHSTGGVGDKISLILAPLVAACGVPVPMVSGRGLGHTGGTLDKLESIPGFTTQLDTARLSRQMRKLGVVMVGQGPDLAPADGLFYALRDVTSTVEFEPFIVSSIVSKKIAEGARAIVYDVKCGNGAFMKTSVAARSLATRLVATSRAMGVKASAFITDMDWPIGFAIGNALEVMEAWHVLRGKPIPGTRELTLALAAEMVRLATGAASGDDALVRVTRALDEGQAAERFLELVKAQDGDTRGFEEGEPFQPARAIVDLKAAQNGYLTGCDCFALGEAMVAIGGGRRAKEDAVDPRVGLVLQRDRGSEVVKGEVFAKLHLGKADAAMAARVTRCFTISEEPPLAPPADLVLERIEG